MTEPVRSFPIKAGAPGRDGVPVASGFWLAVATVLIAAALFLFVDVASLPIVLWDESRNIVNALEMKHAGFSLVTTYAGAPDLWNTKPPLLIWLMTASTNLFGTSLVALRLPAMAATLATLAVVMALVMRQTKSSATAALSAGMLVASPGWFGEHSGRMADYDALLILFTTLYLALLFRCLHQRRPRASVMLAVGGAIAAAVLTKSIAGLIPGTGVVCYLLAVRRIDRCWQGPVTVLAIFVALLPILSFLTMREVASPGYALAALHNDALGRFGATVTGMQLGPDHYLRLLWGGYFSVTPLVLLAVFALRWMPARTRLLVIYSLAIILGQLAVVSTAGTKLNHYILPALPFMAVAAAITTRTILVQIPVLVRSDRSGAKLAAVFALLAVVWPMAVGAQSAVTRRFIWVERYQGWQSGRYDALIASLVHSGATHITVVEPGFVNDGDPHYAPVLRAYRLIWAERGVHVDRRLAESSGTTGPGLVVSCNPDVVPVLAAAGRDIGGVPGCVAVRR